MMRTLEEIQAQIDECKAYLHNEDRQGSWYSQDIADTEGRIAGFQHGIAMLRQSKTSDEIAAWAKADEDAYVSHGDDDADAWQSGYTTALMWVGEQFDWKNDDVIFRPGNILGLTPDGEERMPRRAGQSDDPKAALKTGA